MTEAERADMAGLDAWEIRNYPLKLRNWIHSKGGLTSEWLILKGEELRQTVNICS